MYEVRHNTPLNKVKKRLVPVKVTRPVPAPVLTEESTVPKRPKGIKTIIKRRPIVRTH